MIIDLLRTEEEQWADFFYARSTHANPKIERAMAKMQEYVLSR